MRRVVAVIFAALLLGCESDTLNRGSWEHGYIPKSQRNSHYEVTPND